MDELHYYRQDEVIEFGSTIQHLVREDREIAVAMAGIPQAIRPLLANQEGRNPVTFLRRANRIDLGLIPDDEVRRALEEPVLNAGCAWEPEALEIAVRECGGYPFMIQLLGQQCFRNKDAQTITVESTEQAAPHGGSLVSWCMSRRFLTYLRWTVLSSSPWQSMMAFENVRYF